MQADHVNRCIRSTEHSSNKITDHSSMAIWKLANCKLQNIRTANNDRSYFFVLGILQFSSFSIICRWSYDYRNTVHCQLLDPQKWVYFFCSLCLDRHRRTTSSNNQKSEFGFEFVVLYSWHNHCETSTVHLTNLEQQSSPLSSQLLTRVTSRLVWFKSTAVNPHFWGSGHRLKWWGLVLTVWGLEFVT